MRGISGIAQNRLDSQERTLLHRVSKEASLHVTCRVLLDKLNVGHLLTTLLHETRRPSIVLTNPPLDSVLIHFNPSHFVKHCIPYLQLHKAPQVIGHTKYFCGINNCPTRGNKIQFSYICKLLYMFRVVTPFIVRSSYHCICSIWHY
jgi:hypothetical protein